MVGLGKVAISHDSSIQNVMLVESLGYNLLSVSRLADFGFNVLFTEVDCQVFRRDNHYRNQLLCRLPRRTAKACTADGKGLCRQPRTAKGSGKVGYGKELLCRLLSAADGKGTFAISS